MLDKIIFIDFIKYIESIKPLDDLYYSTSNNEEISIKRKEILLSGIFVKIASKTYNTFGNKIKFNSLKNYKKSTSGNNQNVDFLVCWYNEFMNLFDEKFIKDTDYKKIGLPCIPELKHDSNINFGQFIDAKMIVEASIKNNKNKWELIRYIMSIFIIKKGQVYNENFTDEKNKQFIRINKMNVKVAVITSKWWESINNYINENYTVFQDTGDVIENNENVDFHMSRWGWVHFLKELSLTKAFDISGSGLNSIECVRDTICSDVLIWASEGKEFNIANYRDNKKSYNNE